MTWEIVVGLVTLVGLVATFVSAAIKFSKTVVSLDITIRDLKETLDEFRNNNRESHKEFYDKLDNHEHRICKLETCNEISKNK